MGREKQRFVKKVESERTKLMAFGPVKVDPDHDTPYTRKNIASPSAGTPTKPDQTLQFEALDRWQPVVEKVHSQKWDTQT